MRIKISRAWVEFTLGCIVLGYEGVPNVKSVSVSFTPYMMKSVRTSAHYANDIHSYCWGVFRYSNTFAPVCGVDEYEWGDLEF